MNGEHGKRSVSVVCVLATHQEFQRDIIQGAEQQLHGTDFLKIRLGLYLADTDKAYAALRNLFNFGEEQNKRFGREIVQIFVLECSDPIATLLTLPEDAKQWMQAQDIRVRSASSPPPNQPQPPTL